LSRYTIPSASISSAVRSRSVSCSRASAVIYHPKSTPQSSFDQHPTSTQCTEFSSINTHANIYISLKTILRGWICENVVIVLCKMKTSAIMIYWGCRKNSHGHFVCEYLKLTPFCLQLHSSPSPSNLCQPAQEACCSSSSVGWLTTHFLTETVQCQMVWRWIHF
jgi:hypothetical protein